jgi:hypothetical protein
MACTPHAMTMGQSFTRIVLSISARPLFGSQRFFADERDFQSAPSQGCADMPFDEEFGEGARIAPAGHDADI